MSESYMEESLGNKEDEELLNSVCEVYSNYKPTYLTLGCPHPQDLCEGAGLACVKPPKITYQLKMESKFYKKTDSKTGDSPLVSNAQLEAILYACQAHEDFVYLEESQNAKKGTWKKFRKGFLLGDGTGTGKTRTLAGLVYECHLQGLDKTIWVTANTGLFEAATEELQKFVPNVDILDVKQLSKLKKKVDSKTKVLLLTYHCLRDNNLLKLIQDWTGPDSSGLIIFDEAHLARAAFSTGKPSQTGKAVVKVQHDNPNARIVYSTATGASETNRLFYFTRLGLWGRDSSNGSRAELKNVLETRGVAALELLALEMKMRGVFLSRQVSYRGVILETHDAQEDPVFEAIYDRSCQLWGLLVEYLEKLKRGLMAEREDKLQGGSEVASKSGPFYSAQLLFFGSLIMSSKLKMVEKLGRAALKKDKSVIVGLQHTGDSKFQAFEKEDWNKNMPFSHAMYILRHTLLSLGISVGCPKAYLKDGKFIRVGDWHRRDEKIADNNGKRLWFVSPDTSISVESSEEVTEPLSKRRKTSNYDFTLWPKFSAGAYLGHFSKTLCAPEELSWSYDSVKSNVTAQGLARLYHELCWFLPINPIDELVTRFHQKDKKGDSYMVAELTGRKKSYIFKPDNDYWDAVEKSTLKSEMDKFMDGKKRVCLLSSIASTGYSLHADKNRKNKQARLHITVEYSWGPEQLLQQLGRSHRSNQKHKPTYAVIKSSIPGDVRYVSIVAKRLKQLGAICQGQSMANPLSSAMSDVVCTELGFDAINFALDKLKKDPVDAKIIENVDIVPLTRKKSYFAKSSDDQVPRVFNRTLMLPLSLQRDFLRLIMTELEKLSNVNDKHVYSPIIEMPVGCSEVLLKSEHDVNTPSGPCKMFKFTVSRYTKVEFVKSLFQKYPHSTQFFKNVGNILVAVEKQSGEYETYTPYDRNAKTRSKQELATWQKFEKYSGFTFWEIALNEILNIPGCKHMQQKTDCLRRHCKFQWGVIEILLLCGVTGDCLKYLDENIEFSFRLAKITYTKNDECKSVVGVLFQNPRKVSRIESLILSAKF